MAETQTGSSTMPNVAGPGDKYPMFTPPPAIAQSNFMPQINYEAQLEPGTAGKLAIGQLIAGTILNGFAIWANHDISSKSIAAQKAIALQYYSTQQAIAGMQQEVALKQLGVQEYAITIQQKMHSAQIWHEQRMKTIESSMQFKLAKISEDGRSERAKILSVRDAFTRGNYDLGLPRISRA